MALLKWDQTGEKLYELGCDRAVLYKCKADGTYDTGVAWNGLSSVSESPNGGDSNPIYADNKKYLDLRATEEIEGSIEAYTYPEEWLECDGTAQVVPGVLVGQQTRLMFGLTYRTMIGNDVKQTDYGYKIHLIYGATASPSEKSFETETDSPDPQAFSWDYTTTKVELTGEYKNYRPTASIVIDSTKVNATKLKELEDILYGTDADASTNTEGTDPRLPLPAEVFAKFKQ